jgi:hypothetical protein
MAPKARKLTNGSPAETNRVEPHETGTCRNRADVPIQRMH